MNVSDDNDTVSGANDTVSNVNDTNTVSNVNDTVSNNIKFVDPYAPFANHTLSLDTITLPNLYNFEPSSKNLLDESTFSSYLDILLFQINIQNIYPQVCNIYTQNIQEHFLQLDFSTNQIKMSYELSSQIQNCMSQKTRLVIVPVKLIFINSKYQYEYDFDKIFNNIGSSNSDENVMSAHSNLLIIDNLYKTIEFYEPHGIIFQHPYGKIFNISEILQNYIKDILKIDYYFINVSNTCPRGAQMLQADANEKAGHCLAWSLYFIMVRILNVDYLSFSTITTSQTINEIITSNTPENLDILIRKFITYLDSLTLLHPKPIHNYILNNVSNYIDDFEPMYSRLRNLLTMYFNQTLYLYSTADIKLIFDEIMSYKFLPEFHNIFTSHLDKLVLIKMEN